MIYFFSIKRTDSEKAAGITISVSNVEDIIPPITAIASGPFSSDPAPNPKAAGSNAKIRVIEVIKTGLNLTGQASSKAALVSLPFALN
jgi:hypothetical protein